MSDQPFIYKYLHRPTGTWRAYCRLHGDVVEAVSEVQAAKAVIDHRKMHRPAQGDLIDAETTLPALYEIQCCDHNWIPVYSDRDSACTSCGATFTTARAAHGSYNHMPRHVRVPQISGATPQEASSVADSLRAEMTKYAMAYGYLQASLAVTVEYLRRLSADADLCAESFDIGLLDREIDDIARALVKAGNLASGNLT